MSRSGCLVLVAIILSSCVSANANGYLRYGLRDNFYRYTCPDAERVITKAANAAFFNASNPAGLGFAASFLRMAFHDCFVEGCDGSILLDGPDTEKTADLNKRLFGYEVIDDIKAAVEAICPGVVSCADVLQYATRDAVVALNGTTWKVQGGRKDGVLSSAQASEAELPSPNLVVSELVAAFARRGLSRDQMVILSGSHSVGVGHCDVLQKRLYNFSNTLLTDPSINASYGQFLKQTCPNGNATTDANGSVGMDAITPFEMDSKYYKTLEQHKGLFTSDQTLFDDNRRTKLLVRKLTNNEHFLHKFGQAMRAMSRVGVKLRGQVRTNCRQVNAV